jgi:hypothetical protein
MTKMQIFAKTVFTVLGIYAVVTLYRFYPGRYAYRPDETPIFQELVLLSAFTVVVGFIVYFTVLNNTRLSSKLAGPGPLLESATQAAWLAKSLRVGLVFIGLMLLPNSMPVIVKTLKLFFLIRTTVNDIVIWKSIPRILERSYREWFNVLYDFLKALLALYLICGAPHFIRWQIRHIAPPAPHTEQIESAHQCSTDLERSESE